MAQTISPDLQQAITARFTHGYSRRAIVAELQAAGYESATAAAAVEQVEAAQISSDIPAPPPMNTAATPVGVAGTADASSGTVRTLASIAAGVVAVAVVAYAGVTGWNTLRGGVWSVAPYADGSELLTGLLTPGEGIRAGFFTAAMGFTTGPRQPETAVLSLSDIASLDLDSSDLADLPPEARMEAAVSGVFDINDPERPLLDITSSLTMELDPVFLSMAGSLRSVDETVYGRIDKLPAMFATEIDPIPVEEWLILYQGALGPEALDDLPFVLEQRPVFGVVTRLQTLASDLSPVLALARQALAASPSAAPLQLASTLTASGLYVSETDRQMAELRDQIVTLLKRYPPIRVVGEPARVTEHDQTLFRYEVAFEYENLRALLVEFARSQNLSQREIDQALAEFPSATDFDRVNRLLRTTIDVTPAGALAGVAFTVAFAIPDRPEQEISASLKTSWVHRPDGVTVSAPSPLYPQTLEQILASEQAAQEVEWVRFQMEQIQQEAARDWQQNQSYLGFCERARLSSEQCRDSAAAYIISGKLELGTGYYCGDSSGFSGPVSRAPVMSSYRCQ